MQASDQQLTREVPPILAVEDNPVERKLLQLLGDALGFPISVVSSGKEALRALAENDAYSIVLMDWRIGGTVGDEMDGLECTRRIRKQEFGSDRHISIIAVTAHAMSGDEKACLDAGMDDYLSKPYTAEQFGRKLTKWINHQEGAKTAG